MRRFGEYVPEDEAALKALAAGKDIPMPSAPSPQEQDTMSDSSSSVDEGEEGFSKEFKHFCKYFIPIVSGLVSTFLVILVVWTSGSGSGAGSPKAVLFVFEGLRGDIFHNVVFETNKAPNIRALLTKESSYSTCASIDDPACARTQSGAALGSPFTFQAAPGVASILTGVNAQRHGVYNDSQAAMAMFASTSPAVPTIATRLKRAGFKTAAVGTSKMLTSVAGDGACTAVGVIDYECGVQMVDRCFRSQTCNLDQRVLTPLTEELGVEESMLADEIVNVLNIGAPDLLIIHTNKLARGVSDVKRPGMYYSSESLEYVAEIYQLDAVVGLVAAELRKRSQVFRENWLFVGTSAHGGQDKVFGAAADYDEVVPFFVAPITTAVIKLKAPAAPASQLDIAPTLLQWFGVATPPVGTFDGRAQSLCTDGRQLRNCTA